MFNKDFIKTYLVRGFAAAIVYCITVVIFLWQDKFQSIWLLFLGNALYMLAVATIIYLAGKKRHFEGSPVTAAISGHVLSITGAALAVILSLLLFLLFSTGIFTGSTNETLKQVPSQMREGANHQILFVLVVVAALGNTITGFFAAVFTSFGSSKDKLSEKRS